MWCRGVGDGHPTTTAAAAAAAAVWILYRAYGWGYASGVLHFELNLSMATPWVLSEGSVYRQQGCGVYCQHNCVGNSVDTL
jgi:hypothetical protein